MNDTKPILKSKINMVAITGILLGLFGVVLDANWTEIVSPQAASIITSIAGAAIFILRTYFTDKKIG